MELTGNIELKDLMFVFATILISLVLLVVFGKMWSA
jgi:hypothetical protein